MFSYLRQFGLFPLVVIALLLLLLHSMVFGVQGKLDSIAMNSAYDTVDEVIAKFGGTTIVGLRFVDVPSGCVVGVFIPQEVQNVPGFGKGEVLRREYGISARHFGVGLKGTCPKLDEQLRIAGALNLGIVIQVPNPYTFANQQEYFSSTLVSR